MSTCFQDTDEQAPRSQARIGLTYILRSSQGHDFIERLPTVIFSNRVPLLITDMIVGGDEDADGVLLCRSSQS